MPKLTRIYTRTGDDGTTGLVGGRRVRKDALRIEAYGTVDELSSSIGIARAALAPCLEPTADGPDDARRVATDLDGWLAWTQDVLFNLGCELATPDDGRDDAPAVRADDTKALERAIDRAQADLEPLANFIHPGGSLPGSLLHQARTVARRAERLVVSLAEHEPISADDRRYLNRLSDALFVWSRWINHALSRPERLWNPKSRPPD
jgi:cob(I)alamin adenosyltransferase